VRNNVLYNCGYDPVTVGGSQYQSAIVLDDVSFTLSKDNQFTADVGFSPPNAWFYATGASNEYNRYLYNSYVGEASTPLTIAGGANAGRNEKIDIDSLFSVDWPDSV
jgi:hypothetical protein